MTITFRFPRPYQRINLYVPKAQALQPWGLKRLWWHFKTYGIILGVLILVLISLGFVSRQSWLNPRGRKSYSPH